MLKHIESLKSKTFVLAFLSLLFLILPGVATLYVFKPNLFFSLDWVKIVLLSASITTPLIFINVLFVSEDSTNKNNDAHFIDFVLATIFTGLLFYGALALSYVSYIKIDYFQILALLEIAFVFSIFLDKKINQRKKIIR